MKRMLSWMIVLTLVVGALAAPATAKKKKKKKKIAPVAVDLSYFLRRDNCRSDNDNPHLSVTDGPDQACALVDTGVFAELYDESGAASPWEAYPASNGTPFKLNAAEPITGEITLYGLDCAAADACAPQGGLAAGTATFKVAVFGETGGEEVELGTFEESFEVTPAEPTHTSEVTLEVDPSFDKLVFDGFRIEVFRGGQAIGPGGIEYDDPASFITVPAWL